MTRNNLPNNWQVKTLGNVLESLESGGRPQGGGLAIGDVPSLGAEHLNDQGRFKFDSMKYIPKNYFNLMQRGIVNVNDILVVKDGATTGKVSLVKNDFPFEQAAINEHLFLIRTNKNLLNPQFAFYFLYSSLGNSQIMTDFRGSAQGGISREFVNKVSIPLPPLPIQKQIAEILEKADEARQKRKEANKLTDEFLQSVFIEMFGDPVKNPKGWEKKLIGDLCLVTKLAGFEYTEYVKYKNEGEIIVIRGLNVKNCKLKLDEVKYIDKSTSDFLKRSKLYKDDVVMTYIGINIGDVAIVEESNKYHLAPNVAKITSKDLKKLNPIYLLRFLDMDFNKQQFRKFTTNTAKQALNMSNIRLLEIPIPPISLQQQFAEIVNKTEALKEKQKQSEQELENLFQSLMQKAFKGELVA